MIRRGGLILALTAALALVVLLVFTLFGGLADSPTSDVPSLPTRSGPLEPAGTAPASLSEEGDASSLARQSLTIDESPAVEASPEPETQGASKKSGDGDSVPVEFVVASWENEFEWSMIYEEIPPEEMERESGAIENYIARSTREEFKNRFERGEYEVVGNGGEYTLPKGASDASRISNLMLKGGGGEVRRAELTEAEFPNLHRLRQKSLWLQEAARARRAAINSTGD